MTQERWSEEKAGAWHDRQPWLVGCNFIPSTAINQLEMWQEESLDPAIIDRELGWASSLGFNAVRVYLHDLLWEADAEGFAGRIRQYLKIAARHGIRTVFVLFDDCWNKNPRLGAQPEPVPGVHNSGWVQSPGGAVVLAPSAWPRLERYVREVVSAFGRDARVAAWDLYNEPGNCGLGERSLPLLQRAFEWARAAAPEQPLTSGVWGKDEAIRTFQLGASDIVSFHNYDDAESLRRQIRQLKELGRPLLCTEYMARKRGSRFETHLPIFREERVGCTSWGLVSGKTQTIYPWGSKPGAPEPQVWFHDILRPDGTPFDAAEAECIRRLTGAGRTGGAL